MGTVYFKNIRSELISSLLTAEKEIRIAVAWFTSQELFEVLINKLKNNVRVSLIIIDDYINNGEFGLDFQKFIDVGGELFYGKEENPMHHKFCIIDENILFTGSYNWTYYAENKNLENVVKFEQNKNLISAFIIEFNFLSTILKRIDFTNKITVEEFEINNLFSVRNYLALDLLYRGKETAKIELLKKAAELVPNNKIVTREYKAFLQLDVVDKANIESNNFPKTEIKKNITKNSIGIKSRLGGIDGKFSSIVNRGSEVPCQLSKTYFTVYKDQTQMSIETFKGENDIAEKNIRLGSFLIKDLPKKPAGEASVTVTIKIKINGDLIVKAKSNDTGNEIEANYYDNSLIDI